MKAYWSQRLLKCARMLREQWPAQMATSLHREQCAEPTHYGCNLYQAVHAMEAAAYQLQDRDRYRQIERDELLTALKAVEHYLACSPYATDSDEALRIVQAAIAKAEER